MFVHTVLFWMKPGTPPGAVEGMARDCREMLTTIPTVRHLWAGRPAGTERDVADNSFDLALTVVFDDSAGHDTYQDHATHEAFITRHAAHWARIQVYDCQ